MAVKKWEGAQKDLEGAREDRDFARQRLRLAVQNRNQKEIKEATEAFNKAESKVDTAKEEAERAEKEAKKANEELVKAKSTAPLQAGGAFALLRVQFVQSTIVGFWGHALLSARIPLVAKLHCVGLQHFGEREGLWDQRALGCFRFTQIWLFFVFCRCFRTGCQS